MSLCLFTGDVCGSRTIHIDVEETHELIVKHLVDLFDFAWDVNCIWVVSIPPNSRLELTIGDMEPDESSKVTAGIAGSDNDIDLSTVFMTVTSQRVGSVPVYSTIIGAPVWVALHLQTPSTDVGERSLTITLRAYNETVGTFCGPIS